MEWEKETTKLFEKIISNLPEFHRSIAKRLVKESAEELAKENNKEKVEEEELIKAFFKEVPPAFLGMMERLFNNLGIDYKKFLEK